MPKTRSRIAAPVEKLSERVSFECFECFVFFDAHGVELTWARVTVFVAPPYSPLSRSNTSARLSTSTMRIHSALAAQRLTFRRQTLRFSTRMPASAAAAKSFDTRASSSLIESL